MKSKSYRESIKIYIELSKLKIMIPVSLTGFTGFFIFNPNVSFEIFLVTIGILLLSVAASVLNQIQEVRMDSKMPRTRNRPLPANILSRMNALLFFFINFITGLILIYSAGSIVAALIGLFTIIWYNGIYTYSKRITAFAVFPGAITGALPPLIGWVAAGGGILDKPIVFVAFLFFVGQIPHFWLLVLKYGDEYSAAGFPSLTELMSRQQITRMTFTWVVASVIAALFLYYFKIIQSEFIVVILLVASAFLIRQFFKLIKISQERNYRKYSIFLDSYFLLVMILLIIDKIVI